MASRPNTRYRRRELEVNGPLGTSKAATVSKPALLKTQPYTLDKQKAINKKLVHCDRPEHIAFKATYGGVRFWCQTGLYELLKDTVQDWANLLDKDLRSVNVKEKKDREGINTESLYSIVALNPRKKLYTINMYHTTASGLINGNHIDVFTQQDLPQILLKLKVQNLDVKATNDACKMALKAYAKLT